MTISTTTIKNSYSGDGSTTVFNYTFKITDQDDIEVITRTSAGTESVKTITTDYTVSGVGDAGGGSVTFTTAPVSGLTVILRRDTPQTQGLDLIENDPLPANSLEDAFDKLTSITQELQEENDRSIKLSRTNTMTSTEFTVGATERANKILAFDDNGELSVTQELGTYQGTDTTTTTEAYVVRDIVKSTSTNELNNVYICVADSVVGDLLTDTDHFELLVDAVSAATSATAAATSASEAASSATDAETAQSAAETAQAAAETAETNAETSETNAATSASNASTSETNAATSASNASTSETNAATSESNAATSETNASNSASTATTQAGIATTKASEASTSASNAASSATSANSSEASALTYRNEASTFATNASNAQTAAEAAQAAAELAADNFDDTYLGAKASDPTVDNDGDALNAGDLYFNTTDNVLKYYDGSAWNNIEATDTSNFATNGFAIAMAIAL